MLKRWKKTTTVCTPSCDLTLIVSHQQLNSCIHVQCCSGDCAELRNSRTDELDVCTDSFTLGVSTHTPITFHVSPLLPSSPLPT